MMLAGAEIVDNSSVAYSSAGAGIVAASVPSPPAQGSSKDAQPQPLFQGLAMAPKLDPVDIHFSNITCTVKLGITKGKLFLFVYKLNLLYIF